MSFALSPFSWAEDPAQGEESALDSAAELINDLEEDLSDDELNQAIQEEATQAKVAPAPASAAAVNTDTKVKPAATRAVAKGLKSRGVKGKYNALLILRDDRAVSVSINGKLRARLAKGQKQKIPVKAGALSITLKDSKGRSRTFKRKIGAGRKLPVSLRMDGKEIKRKAVKSKTKTKLKRKQGIKAKRTKINSAKPKRKVTKSKRPINKKKAKRAIKQKYN